jgi:hypothetical protein
MSPTTLKFKAPCDGKDYSTKYWEDSPNKIASIACSKLFPSSSIEGDHDKNGMKYEPNVNSLARRILKSYGFNSRQDATKVYGTPKKVTAVLKCPAPEEQVTSAASPTEQTNLVTLDMIKSISINKSGTHPRVVKCS